MPPPGDGAPAGPGWTRRAWLAAAAGGLGALLPGCGDRVRRGPVRPGTGQGAALPVLQVSGSPHDLGAGLGRALAGPIRAVLAERAAYLAELRGLAAGLPRSALEALEAAAARHAPGVVAELRGLAAGSGVPFPDLWLMNHWSEIWTLAGKLGSLSDEPPGGCSTLALRSGRRILVAHNEDGDQAYLGRLALARLRPAGAPEVLAVIYPGLLPGNGPWINDQGLLMTTNFIAARHARPGLGRFLLDRLAQQARTVDAALAVVGHPARALACHHVLARAAEDRVVAMEATPGRIAVQPLDGLYLHTNHLVLGRLAAVPQAEGLVQRSTRTRLAVLERWRDARRGRPRPDAADLVAALSSHAGAPWSPCRHPTRDLPTATLVTAVFSLPDPGMILFPRQPCLGGATRYTLAG